MSFEHGLTPGQTIDNQKIMEIFKCSPQGGMRRSTKTNTLIIISNPFKSVYEDKWIDNIFHYTGMGLKGDQDINKAQNKTLAESDVKGIEVFLFEVFKPKEYTFIGQVKLADKPYQEEQPDENGEPLRVWIFPLKVIDSIPTISKEKLELKLKHQRKRVNKLADDELKKRAKYAKKEACSRQVITKNYERDTYVAEYARRRANGICQLCNNLAPFIDKDGIPFLETHHIVWLSRGGEDSIENTVALCPNCHRKMH